MRSLEHLCETRSPLFPSSSFSPFHGDPPEVTQGLFNHKLSLLVPNLWFPAQMQRQNRHRHSEHRRYNADNDEIEERRFRDLGDAHSPAKALLNVVIEIEETPDASAMPVWLNALPIDLAMESLIAMTASEAA